MVANNIVENSDSPGLSRKEALKAWSSIPDMEVLTSANLAILEAIIGENPIEIKGHLKWHVPITRFAPTIFRGKVKK